jgi:hypothetical protein
MRRSAALAVLVALTLLSTLSACRGKREAPLAPEPNPPGAIAPSEVFFRYESPDGVFSLEAPERWTRSEAVGGVTFSDGPDGIAVAIKPASDPPTVASVRKKEAKSLERTGRAVEIVSVEDRALPAGAAVVVKHRSNSDPETGKQRRLENQTVLFHAPGKVASVTMWSPQGTNNESVWERVANSFRWGS